jgi:hypothetical protein
MTTAGLEREIGALADLPRAELVARWGTLYRAPAPKGISRQLLVRAVAHGMQVQRYGGLRPVVRRQLRRAASADVVRKERNVEAAKVAPGTRLIREWNGVSHLVEVVEDGFVWNGERHASLSAVARAITGARWSGPRFFAPTSGSTS